MKFILKKKISYDYSKMTIKFSTGTKVMCNEGGCGACAVAMTTQDNPHPKTINSVSLSF